MSVVSRSRISPIRTDFCVHFDLVDPMEFVFHRVLDGHDVDSGRVHIVQRGVQRRGLARTGRSGDQHDPVRLVGALLNGLDCSGVEAQRTEIERNRGSVQHAKYDLLAVLGREGGYA